MAETDKHKPIFQPPTDPTDKPTYDNFEFDTENRIHISDFLLRVDLPISYCDHSYLLCVVRSLLPVSCFKSGERGERSERVRVDGLEGLLCKADRLRGS